MKTEIATLNTTRQQQQQELYSEAEDLKLQRRELIAQKKELLKSVNKLTKRYDELNIEKVEIMAHIDTAIAEYNNYIDTINNIKKFATQHQRKVVIGNFNNHKIFKLQKIIRDGNLIIKQIAA